MFKFNWHHREEFQALLILIALIIFFARSYWVIIILAVFVFSIIFFLYTARFLEGYCERKQTHLFLVKRYKELKLALHGHSVERSRIAMALLASTVLGILGIHRINLAQESELYRAPTDIYWILFLVWYFLVSLVIATYLMWLWNQWSQNKPRNIPLLDGLVASMFFYHGLTRKHRIVTYIAAFFLGGVPSYLAIRLKPTTPFAYEIACGLIIPLISFVMGGAYYAMKQMQNSKEKKVSTHSNSYPNNNVPSI